MSERAICNDSPDLRHSVEGDHHGDHDLCIWCGERVKIESGRLVLEGA